jgi:hypothetical protein
MGGCCRAEAAKALDERRPGTCDLHGPGFTAQLRYKFHDLIEPERSDSIATGFAATGGRQREAAGAAECPVSCPTWCAAALNEATCFERECGDNPVLIAQVGNVDIFLCEPCPTQCISG